MPEEIYECDTLQSSHLLIFYYLHLKISNCVSAFSSPSLETLIKNHVVRYELHT